MQGEETEEVETPEVTEEVEMENNITPMQQWPQKK
jgi:hypothetical protein